MALAEDRTTPQVPWNGPAEFPSRLRGIRHLKRVSAAKLRIGDEKCLYDSFFTLHEDLEAAELSKPFYTSEVVYDSTHPQWCVFQDTQFENAPDPSLKKLLVCVWEVDPSSAQRTSSFTSSTASTIPNLDTFNLPDSSRTSLLATSTSSAASVPRRLLMKVRIDLSELCFISTLALDFPACTLLFELQDGIYTTKAVRLHLEETGIIVKRDSYTDDDNTKRYSCSRNAYIDIISKKRELKAKLARVAALTQQIEQKKTENAAYFDKLQERNELAGRLASLRSQFEILNITFQKKKQELEAKANVLIPTAQKLQAAQVALATSVQEMEQRRKELIAHHQQLTKTFFLIRKHQERLIRDLANVYRIMPVRDENGNEAKPYVSSSSSSSSLPSSSTSHSNSAGASANSGATNAGTPNYSGTLYSINGCTLNNSHFHGQDEEKIATGLGYVCHLVQLLSKYLDIPLRYPMFPMMSRSSIQDVVVSTERYPLYSKAQSIDHFRTAVALLNRNVEQLVLSQGLEPGPLRETLPNLRILLDHFIVVVPASSNGSSSASAAPRSTHLASSSEKHQASSSADRNLTPAPGSTSLNRSASPYPDKESIITISTSSKSTPPSSGSPTPQASTPSPSDSQATETP